MMEEMEMKHGAKCACPHHKAIPFLVVLFAILFFGKAMGWFGMSMVNTVWPVLLAIAGITKLCEGNCKCC